MAELFPRLEPGAMRLMDLFFAHWPQPVPAPDRLARCKLIAHRGEHDNIRVLENTLEAFERAAGAGLWGIELDVRWTRDSVPVVVHDVDLQRIFGLPQPIDRVTRQELHRLAPEVPTLAEVAVLFGGRLHLMIEIKPVTRPEPIEQSLTLQEALATLTPVKDFHLLSLEPESLARIPGFPARSRMAVAYHWPDRFSRWVDFQGWAGLCAHFALMRRSLIRRHRARGQKIGTGFPASRNCLYREINRGIDCIFSNSAGQLQRFLRPP